MLRVLQCNPSPKTEPFEQWPAQVAYAQIQEVENPGQAKQRYSVCCKCKDYSIEFSLQNKRNQCFAFFWIFWKRSLIPTMMGQCPGRQIGNRPYGKSQYRQTQGHHCKSDPFKYFSKMVRAAHFAEKATFRNRISGCSWFTQMKKNVVRLPIDAQSQPKQEHTTQKTSI